MSDTVRGSTHWLCPEGAKELRLALRRALEPSVRAVVAGCGELQCVNPLHSVAVADEAAAKLVQRAISSVIDATVRKQ